jgi:hypothetical protein
LLTSEAMVTPRLVRRVFLPVISDLESPADNPRGYGFAAAGTAICAMLLVPVANLFYSRMRIVRRKLALVGAALFAVGLAAAVAIGFPAPFTVDYTTLHIQLAFVAFIGTCSGTLVCSTIAVFPAFETGGPWGARLAAMIVVQHFFNYKGLLTSLALWEWLLCVECVASLWILTAALDPL